LDFIQVRRDHILHQESGVKGENGKEQEEEDDYLKIDLFKP
jgi:hypothetical protein